MLAKTWAWLRERWRYVLTGLAAALALFLVMRRKGVSTVPSREVERREIDAKAEETLQDLRVEAEKKRSEVILEHKQTVDVEIREMDNRYEELKQDPEALQNWLIEVGKAQRKP